MLQGRLLVAISSRQPKVTPEHGLQASSLQCVVSPTSLQQVMKQTQVHMHLSAESFASKCAAPAAACSWHVMLHAWRFHFSVSFRVRSIYQPAASAPRSCLAAAPGLQLQLPLRVLTATQQLAGHR